MGVDGVVLDLSVAQHDVAAAVLGYFGVVGDEDDGASFGMQLLEQYQNLERSTGVQVTRSFVCQDNGGIVHQGAGDGYALHLTAGHLIGLMFQSVAQPHGLQGFDGTSPPFGSRDGGVIHQR